jgi:sporulation protein YlmC with PRC-barrel domain
MNRNRLSTMIAVLVSVAGTPLAAQTDSPKRPDPSRPSQPGDRSETERSKTAAQSAVEFRSFAWIAGRDVLNAKGESVGSISDMILDRGSGRVDFAVVKTGAVLGIGGRHVALPYDTFSWNEKEQKLVLPITVDELKTYPEFSSEEWERAVDTGRTDSTSPLRDRLAERSGRAGDPYAGKFGSARTTRVEGDVVSVDRDGSETHGEHMVLGVRTVDGATRRIALGPSWYVAAGPVVPMRGQHVVIEGSSFADEPELIVAQSVRVDGKELKLRRPDGTPTWAGASDRTGDSQPGDHTARRYLLLSTVKGSKVACRSLASGTVDDLVLERNSGHLAFLSIDPDENFLGIADTKRLVPWSVVTVFVDGTVHVDANKEMVLASPETPADLTTLNRADEVYKAYQVKGPSFRPAARSGARDDR